MSTKLRSTSKATEATLINFAETSIPTAQANPIISNRLSHFGFTNEKLEQGNALCASFKASIMNKKTEEIETKLSGYAYNKKYSTCEGKFKTFRNKALLLFKRDPEAMLKLQIEGEFPESYLPFVEMSFNFYQTILNDEAVAVKAVLIGLTPEVTQVCCDELSELKELRRYYEKEMGETEQATDQKNTTLIEFKEWLDEYIDMARLAFYDDPQMLEIIGIYAKNA